MRLLQNFVPTRVFFHRHVSVKRHLVDHQTVGLCGSVALAEAVFGAASRCRF